MFELLFPVLWPGPLSLVPLQDRGVRKRLRGGHPHLPPNFPAWSGFGLRRGFLRSCFAPIGCFRP